MKQLKDVRTEFTDAQSAKVESSARFSHKVSRGTLNGSDKTWIKKEMSKPSVAKIEILAQEFFRLLIPHQGETRLLINNATGIHYILSEEVKGYRDLPLNEADNFSNGRYTGLGQVLVGAMFLQEIDLKNGNVGLDEQGRVAKIDGDWCFAQRRYPLKYRITPESIARLPNPVDFYAFNWLDLIQNNKFFAKSSIVEPGLSDSPQFRAEVNQALLMISLLPDTFIKCFVDAYIPAGGDSFVDLIQSRREELLHSATKNPSFVTYLQSAQAIEDRDNLIAHMNSFQANGTDRVMPLKVQEDNTNEVIARLDKLTKPFKLIEENKQLLDTILSHKVSDQDVLLQTYVADMRKELQDHVNNLSKLEEIKEQLSKVLVAVSSPEAQAVKGAVKKLRESSHWYTRGYLYKAQKVEMALCNTPLTERETVISFDGPANKVQEALASHRHWGKGGNVYKTGDKVDLNDSAQTFKDLRAKFTNIRESQVTEDSTTNNPQLK